MATHTQIRMATECYRNVADREYISSRMSFRLGLLEPHLWSAIKALEKYLIAILIYNGRNKRSLSHNLLHILREAEGIKDIRFKVGTKEREYLARLSTFCDGRGVILRDYKLPATPVDLDHTVWRIRRFCMYLRGFKITREGKQVDLLDVNLKNITSAYYEEHPSAFKIAGGFLEQILEKDRSDALRKSLVWKNRYFAPSEAEQGLKRFFIRSSRRPTDSRRAPLRDRGRRSEQRG